MGEIYPTGAKDGWDLLTETTSGITTTYLVPDGQILSFIRGSETYQVHTDGLGSVRVVTDGAGAVVARFEYGAYGDLLGGSFDNVPGGLPYRFVGSLGCRTDSGTGLVYMRHRWYDPELQRFISRDPIGLRGGSNLYAYPLNPLRWIDPTGLETIPWPYSKAGNLGPWSPPLQGPVSTKISFQDRKKRVIERLLCGGFTEEARLVESSLTNSLSWIFTGDSIGLTNPVTLGTSVKNDLSDIMFLDTAVHEAYHVKQGRARLTIEGIWAKAFRDDWSEYQQEAEVYRAEELFIVEFINKGCCIDQAERDELSKRLNYVREHIRDLGDRIKK